MQRKSENGLTESVRNVSFNRIFSLMTLFRKNICVKIGAESFQLRKTAEEKDGVIKP